MSRAGRKRKTGKRYASGDLVRTSKIDHGTPELTMQRAMSCGFATGNAIRNWLSGHVDKAIPLVTNDCSDGMDAIGRAWVAGLLEHEGKAPETLLAAGRKLHHLYWDYWLRLAGDKVQLTASEDESLQGALNRRIKAIEKCGPEVRHAVYSLCVDVHPDSGPDWIDRLVEARRVFRGVHERDPARRWPQDAVFETRDWSLMQNALIGLAALA